MKKLCYVTTISLTLDMFVLESAKFIHENTGWDITFVCNNNESFASKLPNYIHFHPIKMKRGISVSGVFALLQMYKLFKKQKFDLVQYSAPNAAFYAAIASKIAGIPVRLYCQWGIVYTGFKGIKKRIFKTIEKIICKLSTWIEPDSQSNLNFSHNEGLYPKNKGSVIWNGSACGVNLNKFDISKKNEYRKIIRDKLLIPKNAFVFGYVGRVTRDKGVNELLKAIKKIDNSNDNIYLIIVGPEEIDESVEKELYEWSKNNERVKYTGFTNVVEQYLSAMDCFILPSYREGFGMTIVEAEAMGVPVIVTNIPGPIDAMVSNVTGYVVEKMDVIELERAMEKMIINDLDSMKKNCIEFATKSFNQESFFKYLLEDRKRLLSVI